MTALPLISKIRYCFAFMQLLRMNMLQMSLLFLDSGLRSIPIPLRCVQVLKEPMPFCLASQSPDLDPGRCGVQCFQCFGHHSDPKSHRLNVTAYESILMPQIDDTT